MLIFGETIIHHYHAVQKSYSKDQQPLVMCHSFLVYFTEMTQIFERPHSFTLLLIGPFNNNFQLRFNVNPLRHVLRTFMMMMIKHATNKVGLSV